MTKTTKRAYTTLLMLLVGFTSFIWAVCSDPDMVIKRHAELHAWPIAGFYAGLFISIFGLSRLNWRFKDRTFSEVIK